MKIVTIYWSSLLQGHGSSFLRLQAPASLNFAACGPADVLSRVPSEVVGAHLFCCENLGEEIWWMNSWDEMSSRSSWPICSTEQGFLQKHSVCAPNLDELPSAIAICPCDCHNVGWIFLQSLCYARIELYLVPAFMGLTIWPQCWGMCLTFLLSKNSRIIHFSPDDWITVSHSNMSTRGISLQCNIGWLHLSTNTCQSQNVTDLRIKFSQNDMTISWWLIKFTWTIKPTTNMVSYICHKSNKSYIPFGTPEESFKKHKTFKWSLAEVGLESVLLATHHFEASHVYH